MGFDRENFRPLDEGDENRRTGRRRTRGLMCSLGEVLDVSRGGVRVMCPAKLDVDTEARIAFQSVANEQFSMLAKAVWVRKHGRKRFEIGFQFEDPSNEHLMLLAQLAAAHMPKTSNFEYND